MTRKPHIVERSLALLALTIMAIGLIAARSSAVHAQQLQPPQFSDNQHKAIVSSGDTVLYSPTDLGILPAGATPASGSVTSNPVFTARAHTIMIAFNCNQVATVNIIPVWEDGTAGTTIPLATASTASQWDYVWVSDTMTSSAVGATAGSVRLPLGNNAKLQIVNTNGAATMACSARWVNQY